jgi:putative protease
VKILSPVDRLAEVELLADAGAEELYGGYVPGKWLKRYSMMGSMNQRYFPSAQIVSEAELSRIVKAAHRREARFYLTLNAPYYLKSQYDEVLEEAARAAGLGVDAFIVTDLGLIMRLKDKLPGVDVHLSTLGAVFNSGCAKFFSRLGISRMVLPRELTISEMSGIIRANPGINFDAFVMIGKCPNIEGFCGFTHNSASLVWPCEEPYRIEVVKGGSRADDVVNAQMGWSRVNRRQACGLCATARLRDAGVTALKLVGRGGPTDMKVKVTAAVRHMLDMAGRDAGEAEMHRTGMAKYKGVFGKDCNPYICYFPEVWR